MTGSLHLRRDGRDMLGRVAARIEGFDGTSVPRTDLSEATWRRLVRSEARLDIDDIVDLVQATRIDVRGDQELVAIIRHRLRMERSAPGVTEKLADLDARGVDEARAQLADVAPFVGHLDDHQLLGCASLTVPDGWGACLFDEQGTGKTVTTMAAYDVLRQRLDADALLVVAPKSMVGEWQAEFLRFYGPRYAVAAIAGSNRERTAALHSRSDVYVLNYEAVSRHEQELLTMLDGCRAVLAVDESFFVKNPDARRTRSVLRLRLACDRAWVLCGTPAPNHPRDLVAQFDLVDLGRTFANRSVPEDRQAASVSVSGTLRGATWTRSRKDDVLDLPDREFRDLMVPMSPVQSELYEATARDLVDELSNLTDSEFARRRAHFLQRRSALLQLASNPSAVVADYAEIPNKLRIINEEVRRLVEAGEKVVLWSFYRRNIRRLAETLEDVGLVVVDGSVDGPDRRTAIRRFQEDADIRLFVANPAAAGAGLTLHAARHALYESFSNQAAHFLQSLDRIHRRGQTRDVTYQVVLSEGTLEVPEYHRLITKAEHQAALLGDASFPALDRATLLADLTRPLA
jgi:SNF2 family DNA or RNA helicase